MGRSWRDINGERITGKADWRDTTEPPIKFGKFLIQVFSGKRSERKSVFVFFCNLQTKVSRANYYVGY